MHLEAGRLQLLKTGKNIIKHKGSFVRSRTVIVTELLSNHLYMHLHYN